MVDGTEYGMAKRDELRESFEPRLFADVRRRGVIKTIYQITKKHTHKSRLGRAPGIFPDEDFGACGRVDYGR